MANFLVLLFIFMTFTLLFAGISLQLFQRELVVERRVSQTFGVEVAQESSVEPKEVRSSPLSRFVQPVRAIITKYMAPQTRKDLETKLREAGYPFNWTPIDFRLVQVVLATSLFFITLLLFGGSASFASFLFLSISLVGLGLYYPMFYLSSRRAKRIEMIRIEMPDFFDMVNLSIEAGLGLDGAISKVCSTQNSIISAEFRHALEEIRLGKSRRDAFFDLRDRIPLDSFQTLITSLMQADQLGIGMTRALRQLTERIREQQYQAAREKALKTPVKILFPMIFFIFPAMLCVILGPLIIHLIKYGLS